MPSDLSLTLIGAILGTVGGGVISAVVSRRSASLQVTLDLIKEWHGEKMNECRGVAATATEGSGNLDEAWKAATEAEQTSLSMVAHYFEKVELLVTHGEAKRSLLKSAISEYITYWHPRFVGNLDLSKYAGPWKMLLERVDRLNKSFGK